MENPLRVLSLEDRAADFDLILRELRREGIAFTARRVENESDYRRQLEEFAPEVILADYTLPGYDGLTALESARQLCPGVPFIFVTGTMGEEIAIEALQHGATDYVLKQRLGRVGPSVRRALRDAEERRRRQAAEAERERLIGELQAALAKVKTLSGLLPICASCKKIRDDKGYWNQVETYVAEHSEAKFTHGVCPDCMRKLYSDYVGEVSVGDLKV